VGDSREIGLKAVHAARAERQRSKYGRIDGRTWGFAGLAVVATLVVAWTLNNRGLLAAKEELLGQQRAAAKTVGAEWEPLRDNIEKWTLGAASHFDGDHVAADAVAALDFRSLPGLYLRLRVAEAADVAALRAHAKESAKDSFTGCLLRESNPTLARGDADAGVAPEQPWNLHRAYSATRVLSEEWVSEVRAADDKDRLRVFRQQYDRARRDDIPVAIEIVKRAQFFLLVLDEDVPEALPLVGAGMLQEEALQQVPHPARVHIINLKTGVEMARLRRTAAADFEFAGERVVRDPETVSAMKRQVNNCALARTVWEALRPQP
jgi:hypothetical protein